MTKKPISPPRFTEISDTCIIMFPQGLGPHLTLSRKHPNFIPFMETLMSLVMELAMLCAVAFSSQPEFLSGPLDLD